MESAAQYLIEGSSLGPDASFDVVSLVAATAQRVPGAVAVRDGDVVLRYGQLLTHINDYARRLRAVGVIPGSVVVVELPRSWQEIVTLFAILRSGASFTAVDPDAPPTRAEQILSTCQPTLVVGDGPRAEELAAWCGRPLVAPPSDLDAPMPDAPLPPLPLDLDSTAYISFTSGSSGTPKAVVIPHRAVSRLVVGAPEYALVGDTHRYLRLAPLAFDASTFEVFVPLAAGSTVNVFPPGPVAPLELAYYLQTQDITVMWLTAGLFRLVADEAPSAFDRLAQVLTGGDVVPAHQVRAVLARRGGELIVTNGYGPTENTTFTTTFSVRDASAVGASVPIGRPVAGTRVVVVDQNLVPVSPGQVGELLVAGDGLATGYLRDTDLTVESFIAHTGLRARFYRTGDLVRWDGSNLLFCGRADRQVKVRGHRVELSGIEAMLHQIRTVRAAAVAYGPVGNRSVLVACVVLEDDTSSAARVRDALSEHVPSYMVPVLIVVEALPLTTNGKVDYAAVLQSATSDNAAHATRVPTEKQVLQPPTDLADIENVVVAAWSEVLGHNDFDLDEGFFEVGGDSLSAAELHSRLSAVVPSAKLRVVDIFSYPTVERIVELLRSRMSAEVTD